MAGGRQAQHLFVYGTLMVPAVLTAVTGREYAAEPATLADYSRYRIKRQVYPGIIADDGGQVPGILYRAVTADSLRRLDAFESAVYERREVSVTLSGGKQLLAWAYVIAPRHAGRLSTAAWDPEDFRKRHLSAYLAGI